MPKWTRLPYNGPGYPNGSGYPNGPCYPNEPGTESWLNSTIKDHEVFPEGYALYRKDWETGERGGGVFVAFKDHLVTSEIHE